MQSEEIKVSTAIGINPSRVKMIAFGLAGFCAAFSGILWQQQRVGGIPARPGC